MQAGRGVPAAGHKVFCHLRRTVSRIIDARAASRTVHTLCGIRSPSSRGPSMLLPGILFSCAPKDGVLRGLCTARCRFTWLVQATWMKTLPGPVLPAISCAADAPAAAPLQQAC